MASLFTKIINGEIPGEIVHRDDLCIAIKDIHPVAPHHYLIIPIKEIKSIADAEDSDKEILGHLLLVARDLAKRLFPNKGYRLVTNIGEEAGQSVFHLHIHLLGGREMHWPPG
jgi:histidine triad (HIT) family protein